MSISALRLASVPHLPPGVRFFMSTFWLPALKLIAFPLPSVIVVKKQDSFCPYSSESLRLSLHLSSNHSWCLCCTRNGWMNKQLWMLMGSSAAWSSSHWLFVWVCFKSMHTYVFSWEGLFTLNCVCSLSWAYLVGMCVYSIVGSRESFFKPWICLFGNWFISRLLAETFFNSSYNDNQGKWWKCIIII